MYDSERDTIIDYIRSNHPLFYIQHSDYFAVREIIKELQKKITNQQNLKRQRLENENKDASGIKEFEFLEYSESLGVTNLADYSCESTYKEDLKSFLQCEVLGSPSEKQIIVLKDVSNKLSDNVIVSYLKEIAEKCTNEKGFTKIIFIFDSTYSRFPRELESLITIIDIKPLPEDEIGKVIRAYCDKNGIGWDILKNKDEEKKYANYFKGLQKFQIEQILNTTFAKSKKNEKGKKELQKTDRKTILAEKKQLIKKSGILEIIDKPGSINDIGGLENLKDWLNCKARIFEDVYEAQNFGVSVPKGILIVGMPGCGKSLTAKATATLFDFPLVRLDIGSLLGKYVGESEGNMKRALALSEAFAPCVLWIDELEKAFAGIKSGGEGSEIVTRLFGQFLTWMQEKESAVFIVATANSISSLPPEFLRKGRFDELFKVELPTEAELKKIIDIKLKLKKKELSDKEYEQLAKIAKDKGCNGGDVESIINQAIEDRYIKYLDSKENEKDKERNLTFEDVKAVFEDKDTKSVSETLKEKIETLRKELEKYPFRNASKE
jgi:SpoVK/Ycf46/Vps4 family AAA+-type ATPase